MNFAVDYMYRLVHRGGAGLSCDETGVALGSVDLARVQREAGGRPCCEVRSAGEVGRLLKAAYGPQPDAIVQRLHRGLTRTAAWLEAGDLGRAGIEAVMLGFPDLTSSAMAKLAGIADLEKAGAAWAGEPRLPAGQPGGGQWTGGGAPEVVSAEPGRPAPPVARPSAAPPPEGPRLEQPTAMLDDGVYRPGGAYPRLTSTVLAQLPEPLFGVPEDLTPLEESLLQQYFKTGEIAGPKPGLPPAGLEPPAEGPFAEGMPSRPSNAAKGERSLYDTKGGEWRWDSGSGRHHNPHWDYKPPGSPNIEWQNIPWGGLPHLAT